MNCVIKQRSNEILTAFAHSQLKCGLYETLQSFMESNLYRFRDVGVETDKVM